MTHDESGTVSGQLVTLGSTVKIRWTGLALILFLASLAMGQNTWKSEEINDIFDGVNFDVSAAIARVEAKGVSPYDFGQDLLVAGEGEKAKQWYQSLTIATKDPQYIYGLAWVKWQTGDNPGALKDGYYLLHKNPSALLRARTLFLLGSINVDERRFAEAKKKLGEGLEAYGALNKQGGRFLCLTMMAMIAVHEKQFDQVEPLLERAYVVNEKLREKEIEPYSKGRYHEIIGEMRFAQADYHGAAVAAEESESAYRTAGQTDLADEMLTKVALLKIMTGEPKEAGRIALDLWERYHQSLDRGRLIAYNNVTLMKVSECSQDAKDKKEREDAARAWAKDAPGGKALIELLEFVKDNIPCPEWR